MEEIRLKLEKFLEKQVVDSGIHSINVCDILVDYMNNVLLEEEVEEIKERTWGLFLFYWAREIGSFLCPVSQCLLTFIAEEFSWFKDFGYIYL